MDPRFPNWYRSAGIQLTPERLEQAWKLADGLQAALNTAELVSAVAAAFGLEPTKTWPQELNDKLVKLDPSFAIEERYHEVKVLALCAALLRLPGDTVNDEASQIALTARCGTFRGLRQPKFVPEVIGEADAYLTRAAVFMRQRTEAGVLESVPVKLEAAGTNPATPPAQEALRECVRLLADELQRLSRLVALQSEETDMLWGLLVKRSGAGSKRKIDPGVAALTLGVDLAAKTVVRPGPLSIRELIRAGMGGIGAKEGSKVVLANAVNGTDQAWREEFRKPTRDILAALCPVSTAVRCSFDSGGDDSWYNRFKSLTKLEAKVELLALDLACQVYDEQLLLGMTLGEQSA